MTIYLHCSSSAHINRVIHSWCFSEITSVHFSIAVLYSNSVSSSSFSPFIWALFFFHMYKEAVSLASLHTFSFSLGQMGVSICCLLKWLDSKNRFGTIFYQYYWKTSNCTFYIHTEKLHKMQVLVMSLLHLYSDYCCGI